MSLTLLAVVAGCILLAGCSPSAKKERHQGRADKFYEAGRLQEAEIEYLNVRRIDPANSHSIARLGLIYHEQGRVGLAFPFLNKARELEPQNVDVRRRLAMAYLAARKLKEAAEEASFVLARQPGDQDALLILVDAAVGTAAGEQVRQRIEELRRQDRDRASYHVALGAVYLRQKDPAKAGREYQSALALDPNSSSAHMGLGTMHWLGNDLQQAAQQFKVAADLAPARSSARLKLVDFKFQTGATDEARKLLEELTRQASDYLPAWNALMKIAFAERRLDDCGALVKRVVALDPLSYEGLLMSGKLNLAKNEADNALSDFQRMTSNFAGVPELHYHFALGHLLKGDTSRALSSLRQALALDPNFTEAILMSAELNVRKGNAASAIPPLAELVERRPQLLPAQLLLATAYLAQNNLAEAGVVYQRLMAAYPKSPQFPLLFGAVLARQKKPAEARKAFEKSLELAPDSIAAIEALAELDVAEKRFNAAAARINQQLEQRPGTAELHVLLSKVFFTEATDLVGGNTNRPLREVPEAKRRLTEAEAALQKAIKLNPELRTSYLMLAQVYVVTGEHQQALERLNAVVTKTNDVTVLMQIGMIHSELRAFAPARDAYERLLGVNPRFTPALNNLAYLYSEHLGQLDKAYEMANRARQLVPADPFIADTLGWVLYKRSEYRRALGLLEESAGRLPAEPEIQFHLGMTHYMLGAEEPARFGLQRAVQSNRDFPGKEEARRRLALLATDANTAGPSVLAALEKSREEQPDDPVVAARLAKVYERNGSSDKAIAIYENILKRDSQNAPAMGRLAHLYSGDRNDSAKALRLAKNAHTLAPEDALISRVLARLLYEQKDFSWALSLYEEASRNLGQDPELLVDLGWAYYSLGRVEDAKVTMTNALETDSQFSKRDEARRFLAMLGAAQDVAQARKMAPQVHETLKTEPQYLPALMASAFLQEQEGRHDQARSTYESILNSNPQFTPAARNLALLLVRSGGEDQKAYDLAIKVREAFPTDPEVARALGILACRRGDAARGVQLLREIARSNDAELLYYLGIAQYELKQRTEGKQTLQRALALNADHKLAGQARRLLNELK